LTTLQIFYYNQINNLLNDLNQSIDQSNKFCRFAVGWATKGIWLVKVLPKKFPEVNFEDWLNQE